MAYSCVRVHFEIGHEATLRNKKTPNGFTHDWEVFVRGADGADIHHFVDKVVFHLHNTFSKPTRTFKEPPYSLKESGYAGFSLPIDIYLKTKDENRKLTFYYELTIRATGTISNVTKHKTDFPNPSEDFRRKLIRGGGIGIGNDGLTAIPEKSHNASNSHLDDLKTSPHSTSKIKLNNNVDQPKKHKPKVQPVESTKPEEVLCNNSFAALFGPPIKTGKHSPNSKQPKLSSDSKPAYENKIKDSSSKTSKHSPHKEKDREKDRESSKGSKRDKDAEKVKEKEKNKDKETHKEKDKKPPKKSTSPLPPPFKEVKKEEVKKLEESTKDREKSSKSESVKSEKKHKEKKNREDKERKKEEKHKEHEKKELKEKEVEREKIEKKLEPPPPVVPIIKEPKEIKETKEAKFRDKSNEKEEKKNKHKKEKEKQHELIKQEKPKHKHKKKDKHKKEEEKERIKREKTEKMEKQSPEVLIHKLPRPKTPPRERSLSPPRNKGPVNPLNMLLQELSDKDSDSDFSGSMDNDKAEPPKPKLEEKKIEIKEEKREKKEKKKAKEKEKEGKKRKRKSKDKEDQPGEKLVKIEPKDEKVDRSPPSVRNEEIERSPSPGSVFTDAYVTQLKDLQHKIMTLQDNADLQKVVQVISETGRFEITQRTFDFDLCALDKSTVKRLQDMFIAAS